MPPEAHCRFDAVARSYSYYTYKTKNPFLEDKAYYYPYTLDIEKLQEAATTLKLYSDFTSFSKRNTQVKTFICAIAESEWKQEGDQLVYRVESQPVFAWHGKRFNRHHAAVGRNKISIDQFKKIIEAKDCRLADFSVPGHGLFLTKVEYPDGYLPEPMVLR